MVADQNEKLLNESAEKLRGEGHNVLTVTCDVSDKAQVAAMIDLAVKTYGQLDAFGGPCAGPTRWLSRLRE